MTATTNRRRAVLVAVVVAAACSTAGCRTSGAGGTSTAWRWPWSREQAAPAVPPRPQNPGFAPGYPQANYAAPSPPGGFAPAGPLPPPGQSPQQSSHAKLLVPTFPPPR